MAENVQCPVCTLYLHAGMNLSDHLETHPKEQVIRALVQMTISGTAVGNSNTLASALSGDSSKSNATKKQTPDLEEKHLSIIKDNEFDNGSANSSCGLNLNSSSSNCSMSNQSVNSSQNSNNILSISGTKNEQHIKNEHHNMSTSSSIIPGNKLIKTEAVVKNNVPANENITQGFSKQNFSHTNSASSSRTNPSHSYHTTDSIQNNLTVFGGNTRYEPQQRNGIDNQNQLSSLPHMPPPPPPISPQSQHAGQHQELVGRGIIPAPSSGTFHSMQPQQLPHPPSPHITSTHLSNSPSGIRQTHVYTSVQHQSPPTNAHHTQNLKVIYTPNLPPPPPLQLFTYQPQTHLQQHQKPPPAYGTAISQIRSQNNHGKQQGVSLETQQQQALQTHSILQQQQQQHHMQQHQTLHHNIRIQVPPPPPPLPIPIKNTYLPKSIDLLNPHVSTSSRHSHSQLHQQQSKIDFSQRQRNQQQQEHHKPESNSDNARNSNSHVFSSNEVLNKSTLKATSSSALQSSSANIPSHPQVSISPSAVSASIAAVAATTLGRHTNSPFAALLAAAAGAPSPSNTSSVLRYAESPVAHYLERENGDFIVQETPKHIVECVETDNGEFSVIERIYQSPPSVLHIHDDDDDDIDDEDVDDKCKDRLKNQKNEHPGVKQNDVNESEKAKDEWADNQRKSSTNDTKIKKSKTITNLDNQTTADDDFVDFVSVSSDSNDEEDFMSQQRKGHKNTTEKNKKIQSSLTCPISISTTPTQSSPVSSLNASPALGTSSTLDTEIPISTISTTLQSSSSSSLAIANTTSTHQNSGLTSNNITGSRKKSPKNTITVLSDVQLNLNEYLDLVGNIIASSKVAAQRKSFASIAPIPLVKIEKEEPIDEYTTANAAASAASATSTNFETAPPLKASKHETEEITDTPSSSYSKQTTNNNHSVVSTSEVEQDEQEEKKPQVFVNASENEATTSATSSNSSASLMTINSSQVTSVIRMATTSQHQQQDNLPKCFENSKNCNEAEDLSRSQQKVQTATNFKLSVQTPLVRKGPKKLVIKPKSIKTESLSTNDTANKPNQNQTNNDKELPTTSAKAQQEYTKQGEEDSINTTDVKVKNEPLTSIKYENLPQQNQYQSQSSFSILEQHLSSKEPILEFKEEKPCITETIVPSTSIIKEMKIENTVNDDARVLYDFATSKKSQNVLLSNFPSPTSLFSSKQTSIELTSLEEQTQNHQLNKNLNRNNETSSSLPSSTYSSQSALNAAMPQEEQNESSATTASVTTSAEPQHQVYNDFHFNYLYNNGSNNMTPVAAAEQADIKNHEQFSSFYQNSTTNNNELLLEDSSSSKNYTDYQQFHNNHHLQQHHSAGTSQDQWFNHNNFNTSEPNVTPVTSNHSISNINSNGLSVNGDTTVLDDNETGKYLDLDSCKQEHNIDINIRDRVTVAPPPPPSSSTSCSFNDNSMAGITAVGLNIRTDEKMPAKGEISEQESNCDIDNSWSQPMYGDISARFFKTFPAIFPQDNGWNHEEYFTVQDLSASTTAQATNSVNNRMKSFENSNSNNSSNGMPMFSQTSNDNCNIDVMPSTSAKIRKRRKRNSQDCRTTQANGKRIQPTSTITSQQMLMQHQNGIQGVEFNFQHQQHHLQQQHLQQPSTSTAFLAAPTNANNALATSFMHEHQQQQQPQQSQQKQRTKIYECGHCNAKYSKLKDRNAHMIDVHHYVRQNRRLVCLATGTNTPLNNSDMQDVALPTTSVAASILTPELENVNGMGDYKQGIVKIENENPQRDPPGEEPISANLSAKTEIMEDNKQSLALVNAENVETKFEYDTKPPASTLPLSLTTSSSKLTTLYRMLVSFNMTTLKQSHCLSEFDENLIKSSIFFCYVCRQNFNSVKLYDAHLTEHPAECFTCGKKFQRWKNFSLHLKRHLGWKEFGCTVCDKKFVVRSALVEHMRMHSGLSPLKCKVCGKHFRSYSNLSQHRKRHTKQIIRRKEYVCYCGEVLPSKARFLWHKETHDSKPKCCPHCCDRFVHVNSLRRHIRLAHSDKFDYTEPMECPICKQIFAKASMKAHMATHSTETQYDCAICNKSFSTKWNLKIHSWVHANRTAKPFKCEHCPKAFVREVDFKNHMNSHKQIKPYTCEVCGCKFIRKYNYMRHRREHHGNKKYTCDLCKKSFHRHYYLIEHRRIHTGERPFQCSICGKSSTTKTNHNKHLKIHHSRDPFTVEV